MLLLQRCGELQGRLQEAPRRGSCMQRPFAGPQQRANPAHTQGLDLEALHEASVLGELQHVSNLWH